MAQQLRRGRRIGIDYGDVRVGVAVSDPEAILVSPLITLKNNDDLLANIKSLITENEALYIALGSPLHLSGSESSKSKAVAEFAQELQSQITVPIHLIDERLSTKNAQHQMRDVGIDTKDSKDIIDQLAAVNILNQAIMLEKSPQGLGDRV